MWRDKELKHLLRKDFTFRGLALCVMSLNSDPLSAAGSSAKERLESQLFPNFVAMSAADGHRL